MAELRLRLRSSADAAVGTLEDCDSDCVRYRPPLRSPPPPPAEAIETAPDDVLESHTSPDVGVEGCVT